MMLSMSMFANKEAYYKAVIVDMQSQIDTAITYIADTKKACGMATEPTEEHMACWDAVLNAPAISGNKIVVQETANESN